MSLIITHIYKKEVTSKLKVTLKTLIQSNCLTLNTLILFFFRTSLKHVDIRAEQLALLLIHVLLKYSQLDSDVFTTKLGNRALHRRASEFVQYSLAHCWRSSSSGNCLMGLQSELHVLIHFFLMSGTKHYGVLLCVC